MLFEVPPYGMAEPDPRLVYLQTMLGAIEMLKAGVTAVHDDAFHNPYPTQDSISALMRAYADSGLRATVSINHQNLVEYAKLSVPRGHASGRHPRRDGPRAARDDGRSWPISIAGTTRPGTAPRTAGCASRYRTRRRSASARTISRSSRSSAAQHDLPFNIHMLETRTQRVLGQTRWGKSLIRHVHDLGFLDERVMVIHAIWVDDDDIALMADAGCVVAHNPVCNLKLGSGIMPFRKLRDAGIPIALGSDERPPTTPPTCGRSQRWRA